MGVIDPYHYVDWNNPMGVDFVNPQSNASLDQWNWPGMPSMYTDSGVVGTDPAWNGYTNYGGYIVGGTQPTADMSDDDLLRYLGFDPSGFDDNGIWLGNPNPGTSGNNGNGGNGGNGNNGTDSGNSGNSGTGTPTPVTRPGFDASAYINPHYYMQRPTAPFWDVSNTDPQTELGQNRLAAYAWGHAMDQSLVDQANNDQLMSSYLLADMFNAPRGYGTLLAGNTGYVDPSVTGQGNEWQDIVQSDMLNRGMASDDELNGLKLQDWERTKMEGDPYAAFDMVRPMTTGLQQNADATGDRLRETYQQLESNLNGAVDRSKLGLSDNYVSDQMGLLGATADPFAEINDPAKLGLSDEFNQNYNFGQRDIDALKDQAARNVQFRTAAQNNNLEEQAAARGNTSALALNRAMQGNKVYGDIGAADAMTDAEIAGKGLMLDTTKGKEAMRLGTEQDQANRAYDYLNMLTGQGLNTLRGAEPLRLQAEQDISNRLQQNALNTGSMKYKAESDIGALNNAVGQYNINTLGNYVQTAEQNAANRAQATNQARTAGEQAALNTRFGQAYQGSQALGDRYKSIYDQKKSEEQEGRQFLGNLYSDARSNNLATTQQRIGSAGTMFGTANQSSTARQPEASIWDKIMQGINAGAGLIGGITGTKR